MSAQKLAGWVERGMPHTRRGRARAFEPAAVAAWLEAEGLAKPKEIVRTIAEVALHFQVADRTVSYWRSRGMPGDVGAFDLDEIAAWRQREGLARSDEDSVRSEGQRIKNEQMQLRLEKERGRLVAVEPIRRLFTRHIYEAKAIFEGVPDRLVALLPVQPPADQAAWAQIRGAFRAAAEALVHETCRSLADMLTAPELPAAEPS